MHRLRSAFAKRPHRAFLAGLGLTLGTLTAAEPPARSPALLPGSTFELSFPDEGLPPTLYTMVTATAVTPTVTVRLPDDYSPDKNFPLVVYVPGNLGGPKGNLRNATALAAPQGWIAATLPLFKKSVDPSEPAGGIIVSMEDYSELARAYRVMLGRLFATVPNMDRERSALVGFSNGAITIGVLLSNHDEFVLTHFRAFCLVDHGMFHLGDLHKRWARDARYLILVGDQPDMGRELKIKQSQLQQEAWRLLKVDVTCRIMENTGHEFNEPQIALVREWLRLEPASPTPPLPTTLPTSAP